MQSGNTMLLTCKAKVLDVLSDKASRFPTFTDAQNTPFSKSGTPDFFLVVH